MRQIVTDERLLSKGCRTTFWKDFLTSRGLRFYDRLSIEAKKIFDEMVDTMEHENGVGLASTQLGIESPMLVMKNKQNILKMFLPVILTESKQFQYGYEGCLSYPGQTSFNKRPLWTKVAYWDEYFQIKTIKLFGFESVIFQHEFEHLYGFSMFIQHQFSTYELYDQFRKAYVENSSQECDADISGYEATQYCCLVTVLEECYLNCTIKTFKLR